MVLTDNDLLIIYCCVGGGVGLALVLLIVFLCRRRRLQAAHEQRHGSGGGRQNRGASRANNHQDPLTYRSLNHDDDNVDGTSPSDEWRRKSRITQDSSNNGGGDLADYLQNLVDGMERGRAQTMQNTDKQGALQRQNSNTKQQPQQQRRATVAHAEAYTGADQSLLTLVGPSSNALGRNQLYDTTGGELDERQPSSALQPQRWVSTVVRIGPSVDGDGNELSGEKIAGIERWREHVAREMTTTTASDGGDRNGPSSSASFVTSRGGDEVSPSSFVTPASLLVRDHGSVDEENVDDFNDEGHRSEGSV